MSDTEDTRSNTLEAEIEGTPRSVASSKSENTNLESIISIGSRERSIVRVVVKLSELMSSDEEDDDTEKAAAANIIHEDNTSEDENEEIDDDDDDDFYVAPDPNRPVPRKYNPIEVPHAKSQRNGASMERTTLM